MSENNPKLSLVDEIAKKKKPEGPTFRQRSVKAISTTAKATGKGLVNVVSSGLFWCLTLGGGAVWGITTAIKAENREQDAFEQRMEKVLVEDGYKILAVDEYTETEHMNDPSKRLKFPASFERAAIITAEKNTNIYDFAAVRKKASRSGFVNEKIVDKKFFDRTGPGLKK